MSWKQYLKRLRPLHWLYNLWHYKQLKHNAEAYRQYGIHKPLFGSISSKDFPDKTSQAWLDNENARTAAPQKTAFFSFPTSIQQQITNWSDKGYIILEQAIDSATVQAINAEINQLQQSGKLRFEQKNKLMFANKQSALIKSVTEDSLLTRLMSFLLGKKLVPFQTINFITGSQQRAHSDSIHMTTYPLGYLIAAWIALEDITADSGPLFYYPGSHQLPFLFNSDYNQHSSLMALGEKKYHDYEDALQEVIAEKGVKKEIFLAKKGDVLIWHANLVHGGMPVTNPTATRKSMVIHYYAEDVIKYHEITERPSLLKLN